MAYQPSVKQQEASGHADAPGSAPRSSVPDIPGVPAPDKVQWDLREHVARLCGLRDARFPGAQPVSFEKRTIEDLINEDFWVCEKSDGQRVLVFIVINPTTGRQEVFLINRKNEYKRVDNIYFPSPPGAHLAQANNTLLDGELVWDTEKSGRRVLRLLLFDALIVQDDNIMQKGLGRRYGRLRTLVFEPFFNYMVKHPEAVAAAPFEIKVKPMDLSYHIEHVLNNRIPQLKHGNDGLIFTCWNSNYKTGTDPKILKWKPPSENSVDFKLRLRFPPDACGKVPDLTAKPFFQLDQWMGGRGGGPGGSYQYFDWTDVSDPEWEEMKASGLQYDDAVVECVWVNGGEREVDGMTGEETVRPPRWVIKRIRDDKRDGNHASIVKAILKSIVDGVEAEELIEAVPQIRAAWKSQLRTDFREGRIGPEAVAEGGHDPVIGPIRGGPGPPMREGGSIPSLIRR
ncbi:mRNA capping enzyme, alpha subunit [Tilletiaria anomala UBC 951]|uniref:mRNA-capping enzyme subunit alpha n=1 Tax=Tilletiaria anomala (strain ATCC 24038 / CBS 436.72 / UBC 951) TaxID=1037660 RepID=A0A066VZJ3_TILAU|nr:mRNA capping enzyme, alpha subunit [Tilletiaria anomala UBC 951]KDN43945.1 mRNA capping enzyme, alpha subunit [Tilletiaria anomala UBC 951]